MTMCLAFRASALTGFRSLEVSEYMEFRERLRLESEDNRSDPYCTTRYRSPKEQST